MSEVAADHLEKYLNSRTDSYPYLFLSKYHNNRYTSCGMRGFIVNIGRRSGVYNVYPHRFRRTFATNLYKRGMDIHEIQKLMGHSEVQTTLTYIYTDDTQLKSAYEKYAA